MVRLEIIQICAHSAHFAQSLSLALPLGPSSASSPTTSSSPTVIAYSAFCREFLSSLFFGSTRSIGRTTASCFLQVVNVRYAYYSLCCPLKRVMLPEQLLYSSLKSRPFAWVVPSRLAVPLEASEGRGRSISSEGLLVSCLTNLAGFKSSQGPLPHRLRHSAPAAAITKQLTCVGDQNT